MWSLQHVAKTYKVGNRKDAVAYLVYVPDFCSAVVIFIPVSIAVAISIAIAVVVGVAVVVSVAIYRTDAGCILVLVVIRHYSSV